MERSPHKIKRAQRVSLAMALLGVAMFVGSGVYADNLRRSSPGAPDAQAGQILGMIDHSPVFFVRPLELAVYNLLICGWAIFALAVGLFRVMAGRKAFAEASRQPLWLADVGPVVLSLIAIALLGAFAITGGRLPVAPVQAP